jgi:predicted dehydrogenase
MKRRQFLKQVAQTTAALSTVSAFSADRVRGANDRVNVALIGCGGRGKAVAKLMREVPNVDFVAACDAYDPRTDEAKEWAGPHCKAFRDFRKILEMKEVDAVLIATPDHWHAIPAVLACQAGKDVYLEKPMGHNIREGRLVVDAARKYNRIVEVGIQHRSAPHYQEAQRIVQSGALGPIHFVRIWNFVNMYPNGIGKVENSDPPPGADWDLFLGPAPYVPFNKNRFVNTYRWFWDYGGGLVTDFGVHRFDSMHQVLGATAPITVSATGGRFAINDGCETPDVIQVTYEYPGFVLSYEASLLSSLGTGGRTPGKKYYQAKGEWDRPHGEAFYGTNGALFSDRLGFEIYPELKTTSGPGAVGRNARIEGYRTERREAASADRTDLHVKDFIDCVRSRKKPAADAEMGHRASIVAHLGNIAYRTGHKIRWDAGKEEIIGDPEASKLLWREPRKKWDII